MSRTINFIIIIIFIFPFNIHAQGDTDSLENILTSPRWKDLPASGKNQVLEKLIDAYWNISPAKNLVYANQMLYLAQEVNNKTAEADALKYIGTAYYYTGKPDKAIELYERSYRLAKDNRYSHGVSAGSYNIGLVYSDRGEYDKALVQFEAALQIDTQTDDKAGIAACMNMIGITHEKNGDYVQAVKYYEMSLVVNQTIKDYEGFANALHNMGNVYKQWGDYEKALGYFSRAMDITDSIGDKKGMANSRNAVGAVYEMWGEYEKSLQYYIDALTLSDQIENYSETAVSYNNIGNIYKKLGNTADALENYEKAFSVCLKMNDLSNEAVSLDYIGEIYEKTEEYTEAASHYRQSLQLKQNVGNKTGIAASMNNLGSLYSRLQLYDSALVYYQLALNMREELGEKGGVANAFNNLGNLHLQMKKPDDALLYFEKSLTIALQIGDKNILKRCYAGLSDLYATTQDYEQSLVYHRLFTQVKDSIFNSENSRALAEIQTRFKTEQKIIENNLLKEQEARQKETIKRQNLLVIATATGLLLVVVIVLILWKTIRQRKKIYLLLKEQKDEIQVQAKELKTANDKLIEMDRFKESLTGMIIHDLKNPLNTILNPPPSLNEQQRLLFTQKAGIQMHNLVLNILDVQKYEETAIVLNMSNLILYDVVAEAMKQVVFLAEEKSLRVQNHISPSCLVKADNELLIRVFVNLLTNAIKFTPSGQKIAISNKQTAPDKIEVRVQDEGVGISADKLTNIFDKYGQSDARNSGSMRSTGLGLTFCKMVIEAHNETIWAELEEEKGSCFCFTLNSLLTEDTTTNNADQAETTDYGMALPILSDTDIIYLSSVYQCFTDIEMYESTTLRLFFDKIDETRSPGVAHWKDEMNNAIFYFNQYKFDKLKQMLRE